MRKTSARVISWLSLWAPVVIYMVAIFSVSANPNPPMPKSLSDKLMHLLAYSGLAVLVFRAVAGGLPARATWRAAGAALLITIAYGISDELHQRFVPNRTAELNDLYADIAGAAIGLIGCWAWGIIRVSNPEAQIPKPKSQR